MEKSSTAWTQPVLTPGKAQGRLHSSPTIVLGSVNKGAETRLCCNRSEVQYISKNRIGATFNRNVY